MARISRKHTAVLSDLDSRQIKIAVYVRLSNEDNGGRGKDSISNQLELLLAFAEKIESAEIVETYVDNGWSGTDFARPQWERMLDDVKNQKINCIIVKDLSRLARNYLEAGDYLEKIFPFMGVRFIAVNDYYDSANELFPEKDLITEFKNLANDYYSRDISQKVMSAFQSKKERGEYIGSQPPYGYLLKDGRFVIDEPAAAVVRRIYAMKAGGVSFYEIARILNREGVMSPSRYAAEQGRKKYKESSHVLWQPQAVSRILYNQVYTGDLILGKYNKSIYSSEKQGKRGEEGWQIISNAHEAIIERPLFLKMQDMRERNKKVWRDRQGNDAYKNVLEGILVCGICGRPMRRNKDVRNGKARYYFYCDSARNYAEATCSTSSIVDYKIYELVMKQIRMQMDLAIEVQPFLEQMKKSSSYIGQCRQKIRQLEQIKKELDRYIYLKTSIYEDMKQGILTKGEFLTAKEKYTMQIQELETEMKREEEEIAAFDQCVHSENKWLKAFLKFRDATELTRKLAVELLEKVEIYEDKRIHIRFKFRSEYEYLMSQIMSCEQGESHYVESVRG